VAEGLDLYSRNIITKHTLANEQAALCTPSKERPQTDIGAGILVGEGRVDGYQKRSQQFLASRNGR